MSISKFGAVVLWCMLSTVCRASAGGPINAGDTAWMLVATALVLFMTLPGLAFFYGGLVRNKNVLSILMQCFALACLVSIAWCIGVYGLCFGNGGDFQAWIGLGHWFLGDVARDSIAGTIPETVYSMYQMTFAIITPALVIGGVAERMRFSAVLIFGALWLLLVYAPVCHWVWGGGWLMQRGILDFAGGTVVHVNAGVAAIVSALVIGPRKGFPESAMAPHNMTLVVAGAAMLWVGWFGFNAGSALAANGSAGMAMLVTHLAAAAGSLAWMGIEWFRYGKPSVLGLVTGMVAGLGTITPAAGFVSPGAALVIGLAAGIICYGATQFIKRILKIDDSLDVFPVHGVGGVIGTLFAGVFASSALGGVGFNAGVSMLEQVTVQFEGVIATATWCAVLTYMILKIVDRWVGLRVNPEDENEGLDLSDHGERAYSL